ncbi:MAG: hypothetical protein ACP5LH_02130 [Candidatus Micrarchaeia archaeon]
MEIFEILFIVFCIFTAALYLIDKDHEHKIKRAAPIITSPILVFIISILINPYISSNSLIFILGISILFSIIPFYYSNNLTKFILLLIVTSILFTYLDYVNGPLLYLMIIAFSISTIIGVYYRSGLQTFKRKHISTDKKLETKRDIVHIILGIIIMFIFFILPFHTAIYATITLIFLGYLYNGIIPNLQSKSYRLLKLFERNDTVYGLGALYLGAGTSLLIGFIHNPQFLITALIALFFADPLATIFGINIRSPKLPYNKHKSILGTFVFFLVVSIFSYPIIGIYSLIIGFVLAFIESLDTIVDDNIAIAIGAILIYIIFLAVAHQLPFAAI